MIAFAGLSHLGIVSSAAAAAKGFEVVAYDPDGALCDGLRHGQVPVSEPGLPELLSAHRGRIRFTADPAALGACSVVVCAADVPTDADNRSDLSVIRRLLETAVSHAAPGAALVVLSQVPPGFTRELDETLRRTQPDGRREVFYQVETLVFGRAVKRALEPERFIVGCREPQGGGLPSPYAEWLRAFGCPLFTMRYESAELAKIAINMFLTSSISTTNTLAELCEAIGADWSEIVPTLHADRRIGPHAYLQPGLGLAGGNLERDLATVRELASRHGAEAGIVEAWLVNSAHRRDWVLTALHDEVLADRPDPVIAVWGLAYKPQTQSTKHAPALALLDALRRATVAVTVYDPQVRLPQDGYPHAAQASSALEACRNADALAIMTAWPEFASVDLAEVRRRLRGRIILDPFGVLDPRRCADVGVIHRRLGAEAEREVLVPC